MGVAEHRDLASCQAVKDDYRSANTCCRQKERHLLAEVTAHGADQLLLQYSIKSRQAKVSFPLRVCSCRSMSQETVHCVPPCSCMSQPTCLNMNDVHH